MTKPPEDLEQVRRRLLSPRKIAIQLVGFLIGAGLLVWVINTAIENGVWEDLRNASPGLMFALIGLGLLSTILDGAVFWGVIYPYRKLGFMPVQAVNMSASFLNLFPVRVGTVYRVVYHAQVDHVPLVPIIGWFTAILITTMASLGSVAGATLLAQPFGAMWFLILIGGLVLSGFIIWAVTHIPAVKRFGKGSERMFGDPTALVAGLVGRVLVLASVCGRLAVAGAIIGLDLSARDVILLSIMMILVSFNPLGRFGWREATLAFVAPYIAAQALGGYDVEGASEKLALIESAGEALAIIPFGILALAWTLPRLLRSSSSSEKPTTNSPGQSDEGHHPT